MYLVFFSLIDVQKTNKKDCSIPPEWRFLYSVISENQVVYSNPHPPFCYKGRLCGKCLWAESFFPTLYDEDQDGVQSDVWINELSLKLKERKLTACFFFKHQLWTQTHNSYLGSCGNGFKEEKPSSFIDCCCYYFPEHCPHLSYL